MTLQPSLLIWGVVVLLAAAVLHRVLGGAVRLAVRSSLGLAVLAVLGETAHLTGIHLGVNLVNALVLGVLGVPGFGLLLMVQWVFRG